MKAQAHSHFEPSLEYNEDQMPLMNQDLLEFLEKILENNFALSDAEETTSLGLSIEEVSRFSFVEKSISNLPKVLRANFWEVMGSFVLLPYPIFAVSRTLLQQLLVCLNFTLDSDLFCCCKPKSSTDHDSSTSSWTPWRWVRFDLIFTMQDIYIYIYIYIYISTDTCFALPRTHQCGLG